MLSARKDPGPGRARVSRMLGGRPHKRCAFGHETPRGHVHVCYNNNVCTGVTASPQCPSHSASHLYSRDPFAQLVLAREVDRNQSNTLLSSALPGQALALHTVLDTPLPLPALRVHATSLQPRTASVYNRRPRHGHCSCTAHPLPKSTAHGAFLHRACTRQGIPLPAVHAQRRW